MKITHPPFPPVQAGGPPRNDAPAATGDDESFATTHDSETAGVAPTEGPGKSSAAPAFLARQAVIDDPELANLPFGQVVSQIARGVFGQDETPPDEGDGTAEGDGEGDGSTQSTGDAPPTEGTGGEDATTGDTGGDGETAGGTPTPEPGDAGDTGGDGETAVATGGDAPAVSSVDGDGLIAELLEELNDETDEEVT